MEIIINCMNVQGPRVDKHSCEKSLECLEGLQANLFQDSQVELHLKIQFVNSVPAALQEGRILFCL